MPIVSYAAMLIMFVTGCIALPYMAKAMNFAQVICNKGLDETIEKKLRIVEYSNEEYLLSNGERIPRSFFACFCGVIVLLPLFSGIFVIEGKFINFLIGYDFIKKIEQYNNDYKNWKGSLPKQ